MPEEIVGIPDRSEYGKHDRLVPGSIIPFVVQRHTADRAGLHYDVRLGDGDKGLLSWAVRKGLPEPGAKHLSIRQPLHSADYASFRGRIPSGYGKGEVETDFLGTALVTSVDKDGISFATASEKYPRSFRLQRTDDSNWLLINVSRTEPLEQVKERMRSAPPEKLKEIIRERSAVQPKIDGASTVVETGPGGKMRSYSLRTSSKGSPISYTEKMKLFQIITGVPPGTVFRGEVYGEKEAGVLDDLKKAKELSDRREYQGKQAILRRLIEKNPDNFLVDSRQNGILGLTHAPTGFKIHMPTRAYPGKTSVISPGELSGLLNSTIQRSIEEQQRRKIRLRIALFDILRHGKKDVSNLPYEKRYALLKLLEDKLPEQVSVIESETDPDKQMELLQKITAGEHPLTEEGVVVHPLETAEAPTKVKLFKEFDVVVKRAIPGTGKYGESAGALEYALPENPDVPVGAVGSGLSDEDRQDIVKNPENWIGRRIRVKAQEQFPSGALRAPVYIARHEDYPEKV